jgi:PDZ domain
MAINMKKVTLVKLLVFFVVMASFNYPNTLNAQNRILTEADKKTLLTNLSKIIGDVKNNFSAIKNGESRKYKLAEEWDSKIKLFPPSTNKETYSLIGYQWTDTTKKTGSFYFQEAGFADFGDVGELLEQYLFADGFEEIGVKRMSPQFLARAFRSKDIIVEIISKLEPGKPDCILAIGKIYYYEKDVVVLRKSAGPGNKGFGFAYYTNSTDTVIVKNVFTGGPAFNAGFKEGDFIKKINGIDVAKKTLEELNRYIQSLQGKAVFSLLRNNKPIQLSFEKDLRYKFDRECLSGNCINGTGTALSKTNPGQMLEGVFKDGELIDGSWYINAKSITDKGLRVRNGKLKYGRYFTGNIWDRKKPNGGWWYQVANHDLVRYNAITSENFHGKVKCYTNENINRYVWDGEFVEGRKEGKFNEYIWDKNLNWSYFVTNGIMSNHVLYYLGADNKTPTVGYNLTYDSNTKTWSGKFSTQDCCYEELTGVSSFSDLESKYKIKKEGIAGSSGTGQKPAKGKKAEIDELGKSVIAFAKNKTELKARLMSMPLSQRIYDQGYKEYKLGIEGLISDIDKLSKKYKAEIDKAEKDYFDNLFKILSALYLQIDS